MISNAENRITSAVSNRQWDEVRRRIRWGKYHGSVPVLRDRVWGITATRVWHTFTKQRRLPRNRTYRRFP